MTQQLMPLVITMLVGIALGSYVTLAITMSGGI